MAGPPVEVVLLDLAVVLFGTRLLGSLAERLHQPRVLGEIVAGVLVGPTLLGSALPFAIVPDAVVPTITSIGDLGLVLYLFVVGLTLRHGLDREAAGLSAGSFLVPLAVGGAIGWGLAGDHGGAHPAAFAAFTALALSVTALPVLTRIIDARGLTGTPTATLAVAAATVCDLLAWALVAALGIWSDWDASSLGLLALAPLYLAAIALLRPLSRRFLSGSPLGDAVSSSPDGAGDGGRTSSRLVFVVLIGGLLLSAAAAQALRLHFVVGAVLFGAVLPRAGTQRLRASVTSALEPVVRTLLLPVYFFVSGLQLDLRALDLGDAGVLLLVLAGAVGGKAGGAYLGARVARIPPRTAVSLAVLMNTRGLTELIILGIGRSLGLLDDEMYAVLVLMSLVTTAMASPLLDLLKAGRPAGSAAPPPLSSPPPSALSALSTLSASSASSALSASSPAPSPAYPVTPTRPVPVTSPPAGAIAGPIAVRPPVARATAVATPAPQDREWFKRAVFYEVLVRSFADSDGDGTGDLRGLTGKLDYLQWLGVDCLWLPPFYDSPLRDGGYDIRDYTKVLPALGTIDDFGELLEQAHRRGIRVVVDLVLNHTSDEHPWFAASRSDPDGPYGDFYVWADDDAGYRDARVIFIDTETSNWTFDPVRGQYFWHRFFSHQPDLNYDSPAVQEAVLDVMRFWLDLGVDGFRLDAAPYLFEREGTNGENLPETHQFLRRCRKIMDDEYPGRILLAEANQWPEEVVDYFGDSSVGGDECHMAFHFPLMPRIFMAAHQGCREPISRMLRETSALPENCQWGIFLRNHDELTLEMVDEHEREYMWSAFTSDPRMRANLGIRRRLAPLLDNDRDQLRLFTALLLSLPGSPILYYGDEIGMGDNIWLGDRDGVRTPMQWTPDRNAGFSAGDPGRLFLPVIMDSVYGHQAVNVEAQRSSPSSMLWWTRTMIHARKEHPAFGLGSYQECDAVNPATLAFVRDHTGPDGRRDTILCLSNLSRNPQPVEIDLRAWRGCVLRELSGGVEFGPIGDSPCRLALPGWGFLWFAIEPR